MRSKDAGATDLLLFSLDRENLKPIAGLLIPIDRVVPCFKACMKIDAVRSRNGASPALWLQGIDAITIELQNAVEKYATENLLDIEIGFRSLTIDDALEDLDPDLSLILTINPQRRSENVSRFVRDPGVRDQARKRANGRCELCNAEGFLMENGNRYLETHHIQSLGDEGPDIEANVIALCANDHRAAHFSTEKNELAEQMRLVLSQKLRVKKADR